MLSVIGVDPVVFFAELHDLGVPAAPSHRPSAPLAQAGETERLRLEIKRSDELLQALVNLLVERRVITAGALRDSELKAAARSAG